MNPTPTPPERAEAHDQRPARVRVRYPWHQIIEGRWQQWLNLPESTAPGEAYTESDRVRAAARDYARRHGFALQSRVTRMGRTLDLKFTRSAER